MKLWLRYELDWSSRKRHATSTVLLSPRKRNLRLATISNTIIYKCSKFRYKKLNLTHSPNTSTRKKYVQKYFKKREKKTILTDDA